MDLHPYAKAVAEGDQAAAMALVADDVIFHSPVISDQAFHGKAAMAALLEIVFRELEILRYTHGWRDEASAAVVADGRIRGKDVKVTNLLELDSEGRIREIWVMARPLVGVVAIGEGIGDGLARREVPRRARALALAMRPIVGMAAMVDRIGSGLVRSLNRSAGEPPG